LSSQSALEKLKPSDYSTDLFTLRPWASPLLFRSASMWLSFFLLRLALIFHVDRCGGIVGDSLGLTTFLRPFGLHQALHHESLLVVVVSSLRPSAQCRARKTPQPNSIFSLFRVERGGSDHIIFPLLLGRFELLSPFVHDISQRCGRGGSGPAIAFLLPLALSPSVFLAAMTRTESPKPSVFLKLSSL